MRCRALLLVVLAGGCVTSSSLDCPGDLVCPPTNLCRTVEQQDTCVLGDWVEACEGMHRADGDPCDAANPARHCVDGVCIVTCGNGFLDPAAGEECDDGNLAGGDGCSKTCHLERCGNGELDPQDGELCDDGGPPVSGDGCSSTCRPETATWRDITPAPLSARAGMAAAHAEGLGVDVLFGGTGQGGTSGETWLYDGTWRLTNPAVSPPPRTLASMVWDPANQRIVMFGGIGAAGALADTWAWQVEPGRPLATATWTQLAPMHAPPGRYKAALGYDPNRNRIVVFGGTGADGNGLADVWEFDGTDWVEKHPAPGLPAIGMAQMAYQRGDKKMIVCQPGQHAQIWDGGAWTDQGLAPCPNQPGFAMMTSPSKSNVYMVFVNAGSYVVQAWAAGLWLTSTQLTKPPTRQYPVWVEAPFGNILLFGGSASGNLDDRSQLVDDAWILASNWTAQPEPVVVPEARAHAAIAYDDARGRIVLTGGVQGTQTYADTWVLDGEGWRALPIAGDAALVDGALAYDTLRGALVRFGGRTSTGLTAAVAELAATDDAWTPMTAASGPSARAGVALAYDGAQVVAFGGETAAGVVGETWRWNGLVWTPVPGAGPSARRRAAATYDVARGRVVMFGGALDTTGDAFASDTWEWDGAAWTHVATPTSPAARAGATLTYDPVRRVSILMGGADATTTFGDRWEWDGHAWKAIADDPARARSDASAAYHAVLGGLVLFGGARGPFGGLAGSVELLRYDSEVARETCRRAADDLDGDGLAGCADPDCWARCTPGCPPGATCPPSLPHCGDGTCSSIEDDELCPADCPP